MKINILVAFSLIFTYNPSHAEPPTGFVLCDKCEIAVDFEKAAIDQANQTEGSHQVYVGNTSSGKVFSVSYDVKIDSSSKGAVSITTSSVVRASKGAEDHFMDMVNLYKGKD